MIMKLKDIFTDKHLTQVFSVSDNDNENPFKWTIEPTDHVVVPYEEGHFILAAKQVFADRIVDCYVNLITPERISEIVFKLVGGKVVAENIYDQEATIVPSVASNCYGDYELYYAKENPQIGIDILKEGLTRSNNKTVIAEDLGYILRDEKRFEEAIQAFEISATPTPSSEYIYYELAQLYNQIGDKEKALEYQNKFQEINNGQKIKLDQLIDKYKT
jgi:tetratricopeptide (TPR) repeat protein